MKRTSCPSCVGFVLSLAIAASASAQAVLVVAGDGSGDFVQLQQAVTAAADGDVILVRPSSQRYDPTVIDGKSLTIVGDGDIRPQLKRVRVDHLNAGSTVSLRFLDIDGSFEFVGFPVLAYINFDALSLNDCAGCVWLEDLVLHGADGLSSISTALDGKTGLDATASQRVVLVRSEVGGGFGALSTGGTPHAGARAARASGSRLAAWGCTFVGGEGGIGGVATPSGAVGGVGVECSSSTGFLSGSALTGGNTGRFGVMSPTPTASGLVLADACAVQHLATTIQAGAGPAPPGPAVTSSGAPSSFDDLADDHRQITIAAAVRELAPAAVSYSGQPGDLVLLAISLQPAWSPLAKFKGVLHVGPFASSLILGIADAAGALDVLFSGPTLPPGVEALTAWAQPVVAEPDGSPRLGAPSSILILDASFPPP